MLLAAKVDSEPESAQPTCPCSWVPAVQVVLCRWHSAPGLLLLSVPPHSCEYRLWWHQQTGLRHRSIAAVMAQARTNEVQQLQGPRPSRGRLSEQAALPASLQRDSSSDRAMSSEGAAT